MYYWRVLHWRKGQMDDSGEPLENVDYSPYVVAPIFLEDRLDETLDTGEIILKNLPRTLHEAFPPKTKFRIERYLSENYNDNPKKWDMVVEHDDVEEYVGYPDVCTHRIALIEASVIAQGLHVDNIALTYELQDVSLGYRTEHIFNTESALKPENVSSYENENVSEALTYTTSITGGNKAKGTFYSSATPQRALLYYDCASTVSGGVAQCQNTHHVDFMSYGAYDSVIIRNRFCYHWKGLDAFEKLASEYEYKDKLEIEVPIPQLWCVLKKNIANDYVDLMPMGVEIHITQTNLSDGTQHTEVYYYDPKLGEDSWKSWIAENDAGMQIGKAGSWSYANAVSFTSGVGARLLVGDGQDYNTYYWDKANLSDITASYDDYMFGEKPCNTLFCAHNDYLYKTLSYVEGIYYAADKCITDTVLKLTVPKVDDNSEGYRYDITYTVPQYAVNGMFSDVEVAHYGHKLQLGLGSYSYSGAISSAARFLYSAIDYTLSANGCMDIPSTYEALIEKAINCKVEFSCVRRYTYSQQQDYLAQPAKYSCYDLLRKAIYTTDTKIIQDSQDSTNLLDATLAENNVLSPIALDEDWEEKLASVMMYESTFENKNLWEVLLQIGYYLHAIPFFEFCEHSDKLLLSFRQLGDSKINGDCNTKITIYNTNVLSEYFAQYDSYVTNFFSPQNTVEEYIVLKTNSNDYLVYADTVELSTSHGILEVEEFEVYYDEGKYKKYGYVSVMQHIYEKSIYNLLTSYYNISPGKADSLYYTLGDTKIEGLTYVPPSQNNDKLYAIKTILAEVYQVSSDEFEEYAPEKLIFRIKYKTQDSLRFTQVRPDLGLYMKNASDQYPHHEQYYGQQDKIVDSERFSANLFGKLIRMGNAKYQRQEFSTANNEKESGDLVWIHDEPYYVTEVENEYYADAILQKVTYSKNFNQLSNIVTIPSEPRFYEVSERGYIRREIRMMEFLQLSSKEPKRCVSPTYLCGDWKSFIMYFLFGSTLADTVKLPNYVITKFTGYKNRVHLNKYNVDMGINHLFPTGKLMPDDNSANKYVPQINGISSACIVPVLRFPANNTLSFEWDMEDNFKAGNCVGDSTIDSTKDAYRELQSVRYCDIFGGADLFSFALINLSEANLNCNRVSQIPDATGFLATDVNCCIKSPENSWIVLNKDNREALSFNFQINLLYDDFIVYSNIWGEKNGAMKIMLRKDRIPQFSQTFEMFRSENILADGMPVEFELREQAIGIRINVSKVDVGELGSIVLYSEVSDTQRSVYIVRNVDTLSNEEKAATWWIYPTFTR